MSRPKTFTARGPVDLIAVVPYVLGFHPEDSVVLLTFGASEAFHARVDLPADEDEQVAVAELLRGVVSQHGVGRVALLVYTEDPWVAATFHDAAVPVLVSDGVEVIDVLRVGRDRFHSASDLDDPGTAYDLRSHPFTAEQVVAGAVVHVSRDELAASLAFADGADAAAVAGAAEACGERFAGLAVFARDERISRDLTDEARWIQRTVRRCVRHGGPLAAEDAGRLLMLISGVMLRDVAWAEMSRAEASRHVELWRDLLRRCPRALVPPTASLLAFAAWLDGHGALAWCALDRCVEVDPAYSMAECVSTLLERAVPPSVWTPIEEDELAAFGATGLAS